MVVGDYFVWFVSVNTERWCVGWWGMGNLFGLILTNGLKFAFWFGICLVGASGIDVHTGARSGPISLETVYSSL